MPVPAPQHEAERCRHAADSVARQRRAQPDRGQAESGSSSGMMRVSGWMPCLSRVSPAVVVTLRSRSLGRCQRDGEFGEQPGGVVRRQVQVTAVGPGNGLGEGKPQTKRGRLVCRGLAGLERVE